VFAKLSQLIRNNHVLLMFETFVLPSLLIITMPFLAIKTYLKTKQKPPEARTIHKKQKMKWWHVKAYVLDVGKTAIMRWSCQPVFNPVKL